MEKKFSNINKEKSGCRFATTWFHFITVLLLCTRAFYASRMEIEKTYTYRLDLACIFRVGFIHDV